MRKTLIIGASVLLVLALIAGGVAYWTVFKPNTEDFEEARSLHLPQGVTYQQAVDSLEARNLLESERTFKWMASLTGWGDQIKPGHYRIQSGMSNRDILDKLRRGLRDPVKLTIPPGTRPKVAAAVVGSNMSFTRKDFLDALRDTSLAAKLNTDTTHLFSYMRPETYEFYWLNSAADVVSKIKRSFDDFYQRLERQQPDSMAVNLTKEEVLRLASIVEWETYYDEEKPRIAGVYLNRLERGMPLQADPTIQYALLQSEGQKRRLLFEDYELDHPYNTYNYRGLPPGPLNNPSPSSVRAVMNPEQHDYFYFVVDPDSSGHTFSRTLREHNRAAERYRRAMRERRRQQRDSAAAAPPDSAAAGTR